MTDTAEATNARRLARLASGRLRHSRWLLATAIVSVMVMHGLAGGTMLFTIGIVAALVLVAALAPRLLKTERAAAVPAQSAARRSSELSAASLAAAVADPLIVFDTRGAVVLANSAAASAFGDMEVGISLPLKFRAPEIQQALEQVLSGHSASETIEYTERVPFERVFKVTATAIGNGSGLFVIVFEDRSESRRIDRMRADFIANASHELRTPLASIAGFVETLRGPARDDQAAREQFLQIMQNQTSRMARLIDDLLSLSRLEMKALSVGSGKVDLVAIIANVVETLRPLAADIGVSIENRIDDRKAEIVGDRDELFQVFENLVENACKYGQSGGEVELSPCAIRR